MAILVKNALNKTRLSQGVSAVEMANFAGIARQTVYAIEAGKYVPNIVVALKIAAMLGTTVEKLFWLDPIPAKPARRCGSKR